METHAFTIDSEIADIRPVHTTVRGRARFQIAGLRKHREFAVALQSALGRRDGIRQVFASEVTGNLLVVFDPSQELAHVLAIVRVAVQTAANGGGSSVAEESVRPKLEPAHTEIPWHVLTGRKVEATLNTSVTRGLPEIVALERLRQYGPNTLAQPKCRSAASILIDQFKSLPVVLLLGSAVLSVAVGAFADAAVIAAVVVLNASIGFATELKSERTITSLLQTTDPGAVVIRDGKTVPMNASKLVPGDVILLARGWQVPADARLLTTTDLSVDESALTGESTPVRKTSRALSAGKTALPDRINMVYRGTIITGGTCIAIVVATGANTEIGNVQRLIAESDQPATPLQKQMGVLGNQLVAFTASVAVIVAGIGLLRGYSLLEMVRTGVSLAIAAVPEGLPTIATVALATAVNSLREQSVLVRRLAAVETLGSLRVLCFDKTGTLTLNQMSVNAISDAHSTYRVIGGVISCKDRPVDLSENPELMKLIEICSLCSEAEITESNGHTSIDGSATEAALVRLALQCGMDVGQLRRCHPVSKLVQRTERRNYMVTVHGNGSGKLVAVKGTPQEVLALCRSFACDGSVRILSRKDRKRIEAENERMAGAGLRVLGVAFAEGSEPKGGLALTWLGLVGIADPPREGLPELLRGFRTAGVRALMVTGDQPATARAIAEAVQLNGQKDVAGRISIDLEDLSAEEWREAARETHVFARVSPSLKLKIVRALQRDGNIVAMTGDGINDGPALKAADIGIALGKTGTQVARGVADIVLANDNIQAILPAIREGRRVYTNLRKAVHYICATNLSEILVTVASLASGLGQPLNPRQLLWINLLTDVFPELAMATDSADPNILNRRPLDANRAVVTHREYGWLGAQSSIMSVAAMVSYILGIGRYGFGPRAESMAFVTLTSAQLLHALTVREHYSGNPLLVAGLATGFVLLTASQIISPVSALLGTVPIGLADVIVCGCAAMGSLLSNQLLKSFQSEESARLLPAPAQS